jgi:hypothetical protein
MTFNQIPSSNNIQINRPYPLNNFITIENNNQNQEIITLILPLSDDAFYFQELFDLCFKIDHNKEKIKRSILFSIIYNMYVRGDPIFIDLDDFYISRIYAELSVTEFSYTESFFVERFLKIIEKSSRDQILFIYDLFII